MEAKVKPARDAAARAPASAAASSGRGLGSTDAVSVYAAGSGPSGSPPAVRILASTWTCDGRLFVVAVSRALDENDGANHTYHSRGATRARPRVSRMDSAMARRRDPHIQVSLRASSLPAR